ncbi:hypothetical protein G6O67_001197 [Ophiocordyceps sinensis]|uniref:Uncharacterized protein n=1 Tax=Ophiocordyceps sinensis TaxID=72228 RepID=A0A8H4PX63_9HYPO|nr:hypothetical protein G6O67_001197 [Ophiocordyceps sinensis]
MLRYIIQAGGFPFFRATAAHPSPGVQATKACLPNHPPLFIGETNIVLRRPKPRVGSPPKTLLDSQDKAVQTFAVSEGFSNRTGLSSWIPHHLRLPEVDGRH